MHNWSPIKHTSCDAAHRPTGLTVARRRLHGYPSQLLSLVASPSWTNIAALVPCSRLLLPPWMMTPMTPHLTPGSTTTIVCPTASVATPFRSGSHENLALCELGRRLAASPVHRENFVSTTKCFII